MRRLKNLARTLVHTMLRGRQELAQRLIADFHRRRASNDPRFGLAWRAVFAVYLFKRYVQETLTSGLRWRPRELTHWKLEIETSFVNRLFLWSTRPIGAKYDPYRPNASNNRLMPYEADRMRELAAGFEYRPLLSVIVPIHNTRPEWLDRLVDSVRGQTYDRWELLLIDDGSPSSETQAALSTIGQRDERITVERLPVNRGVSAATNRGADLAHGEFLAFLDHDDDLAPDALWWIVQRLQDEPDCDMLYTDEEYVPVNGDPPYPYFKPDFSPESLTAYNYFCHLLVVRKRLFDDVGKLRPETDGAQDFDLILRVMAKTQRVAHIPRPLYRWHITPKSLSRVYNPKTEEFEHPEHIGNVTRQVVQSHLDRFDIPAAADIDEGWVRPTFKPVDHGKVSIIICTRDNPGLLRRAVRSIERMTEYPNYEIVIVDNGSRTWRTHWLLSRLARRHRVLRIPSGPEGFNFSALNNEAVRQVGGKYILFLNDDTQVLKPGWLSALVGYHQFSGVGATGARLLFPNRLNQHAGVIMGAMGWGPWHALIGLNADTNLYFGYFTFPHNCIAVTGACLMTPRELFLDMGGFNEEDFAVSFNDVDYCLRLHEAGYRSVYVPQAELIHYEGRSRGNLIDPKEAAALRARYPRLTDPYWNPNFTRMSPHFGISSRRQAKRLHPSESPRVLVVAPPSRGGDAWPHWEPLFAELARRGRCAFTPRRLPRIDPSKAGRSLDLSTEQERSLRHDLEHGGYDVVFAQGARSTAVIELAHELKIPSVWSMPEQLLLSERRNLDATAELLRIRQALRLPYQVVFNNAYSLAWAACGEPPDNFVVAEGCLFEDATESFDRETARNRLRGGWGISPETVVFLAVERMDGSDSWRVILDAYRRLSSRQRRKAFLLAVVHSGVAGQAAAFRAEVSKLGPGGAVVVNPADLRPFFAAADVFVSHPTVDARPLSVLQAMQFGLPILGTRRLLESDLLYPRRTGVKYSGFRPAELAGAISRIIDQPRRRRRYGAGSRHWLDSRAHPEYVLTTWSDLLLEAAELNPARTTQNDAGERPTAAMCRFESREELAQPISAPI